MSGLNFIFFLNLWSHIAVLWILLTAVFWLLISKKESEVLTNEFTSNISNNLTPALQNADQQSGGALKTVLKPTLPAFQLMSEQYKGRDKQTETFNNMLLVISSLVGTILVVVVITALLVAKTVAKYPDLWKSYRYVILEQVVLMIFIGIVEATFFLQVASKFVPTKPSLIVNRVIDDLKIAFD
jgi:hypothetical protein